MAKIWIPKSWSGTNPPASGTRVFVGGKGAGKSVYETISAGQTKRCLQSNGKGSVFYGNVTIADPAKPLPSSDINLNGIDNIEVDLMIRTTNNQYFEASIQKTDTTINFAYITDCEPRSITSPSMNDGSSPVGDTVAISTVSGHNWGGHDVSALRNVKKISISLNDGKYWVYYVTFVSLSERLGTFTINNYYTNVTADIARDAQAQARAYVNALPNGYISLNSQIK